MNEQTIFNSYKLFARPSFLEGIVRAFDIGSTLQNYNYAPSGAEADYEELKNDMILAGKDLEKVYNNYKENNVKKKK